MHVAYWLLTQPVNNFWPGEVKPGGVGGRFFAFDPVKRRPSAPLPDSAGRNSPRLVDRAPESDDWVHEIKIDGYRVAARMATLKLKSASTARSRSSPRRASRISAPSRKH